MSDSVDQDPWRLEYDRYDPDRERLREALCVVGNGLFATRGAAPESVASDSHYPGTYVAGVYNRLTDEISGREIENESLVNAPNWLPLTFRIDDGPWFDVDQVNVIDFRQILELRRGLLTRRVRMRDDAGRETTLMQRRLVHMGLPHLAALETTIQPENWSGHITIRAGLDGGVENEGVARYRKLAGTHLQTLEKNRSSEDVIALRSRTVQSRVEIVEAARTRLWHGSDQLEVHPDLVDHGDFIGLDFDLEVERGKHIRVEKNVALFTSRDTAIAEAGLAACTEVEQAGDFSDLETSHVLAWDELWRRYETELEADKRTRLTTNLHIFHLLQTASPNTIDRDVGIPARGLHGEAYRGHIFWDELFAFPMLTLRVPEIARSLLRYRHRRLPAARRAAREAGLEGAMYPWQSGSDGREESQVIHLNPESGRWIPDKSHRQRHINVAIAYNIWQYFLVTQDVEFMARYGAETLLEIARFWASIAERDPVTDRYNIVGVMGPDEFHDADPNWNGPGLRNNAYTNVMAAWVLSTAPQSLRPLPGIHRARLLDRLGIDQRELDRWDEISRKLVVPITEEGIISQFEGYDDLEELDWEGYEKRYGDIHRLDRILEAEGDDVNRYKASKQADVLMLFYLLSFEELCEQFRRLDIDFDADMLQRNVDYYLARTSHGSTLSGVVHSWVLARTDRHKSRDLFCQALESDIADIQGGTTEEGIHLGAMAGTVDLLQRGYSGIEFRDDTLHFKPSLPDEFARLRFHIYYRQRWLTVTVEDDQITVASEITVQPPIQIESRGETRRLASGESVTFART